MRLEDLADRHEAHAHDALAQVAELPIDGRRVLLDRPPLRGRQARLGSAPDVSSSRARLITQVADVRINSSSRASSTRTKWEDAAL